MDAHRDCIGRHQAGSYGRTTDAGRVHVQASIVERERRHTRHVDGRTQRQKRTANVTKTAPRAPRLGDHPEGAASTARGYLAAEKIENRFGNSQRASATPPAIYVINNRAMLMCLRRLRQETQATCAASGNQRSMTGASTMAYCMSLPRRRSRRRREGSTRLPPQRRDRLSSRSHAALGDLIAPPVRARDAADQARLRSFAVHNADPAAALS